MNKIRRKYRVCETISQQSYIESSENESSKNQTDKGPR